MGSLGSKNVIAKTSTESPLYDGRAEDGNFPTVTSASGTFGGEMTLNGFFSAKNSSQAFFYKGDPENVGVAPFGNAYKSSLVDSYSGNGACLSAPKNSGQTGIGEMLTGNERTISVPATDEFFFTGMMKIVTENYGGSDAQVKIFRILNAAHQALMYATPQWIGNGTGGHNPVGDFIWSVGFNGASGYGTNASGNAVIDGEWIRYFMYYKASANSESLDGSQMMARKNSATNELFFQFWESGLGDHSLNDWRKTGNAVLPIEFKTAGNVANMFDRQDVPPRSNVVTGIEMPYYARDGQVFEVRLDCLLGNNSMESVVYANNANLNAAFESGKIEFGRQISRNDTQIVVDTSVVVNRFLTSENVYEFVVNSNRQYSSARLVRAAV